MLYWAYGSNLNKTGMRRRCPAARRVGPLTLDEGALIFRGVADVEHRAGSKVPGGVWRITKACERSLDAYEGVGSQFYLKRYLKLKVQGVTEDCLYYQMVRRVGIQPPAQHYLDTIVEGYEFFGLDKSILNAALQESWDNKALTPHLRDRFERKGRPRLARLDDLPRHAEMEAEAEVHSIEGGQR